VVPAPNSTARNGSTSCPMAVQCSSLTEYSGDGGPYNRIRQGGTFQQQFADTSLGCDASGLAARTPVTTWRRDRYRAGRKGEELAWQSWPGDGLRSAIYFLLIGGISVWSNQEEKGLALDYFLANETWAGLSLGLPFSRLERRFRTQSSGCGRRREIRLAMGHYKLHSGSCHAGMGIRSSSIWRSKGLSPCRKFPGKRRYNEKTRWLLSIVQLLSYSHRQGLVTIYAGRRIQLLF